MSLPRDAGDGLATERLRLERFRAGDLPLLDRLHSDPEVMRYMGGVMPRDTSAAMLRERILDYYPQHPGLGVWKTVERATGAFTGFHVLNHIRGAGHIQVGYCLHREFWGRGYASEMARALLRYGFSVLGLPQITAITDPGNTVSQHVLVKCGLERRGERCFAAYANGAPMAWFERDAADWLANNPA